MRCLLVPISHDGNLHICLWSLSNGGQLNALTWSLWGVMAASNCHLWRSWQSDTFDWHSQGHDCTRCCFFFFGLGAVLLFLFTIQHTTPSLCMYWEGDYSKIFVPRYGAALHFHVLWVYWSYFIFCSTISSWSLISIGSIYQGALMCWTCILMLWVVMTW